MSSKLFFILDIFLNCSRIDHQRNYSFALFWLAHQHVYRLERLDLEISLKQEETYVPERL